MQAPARKCASLCKTVQLSANHGHLHSLAQTGTFSGWRLHCCIVVFLTNNNLGHVCIPIKLSALFSVYRVVISTVTYSMYVCMYSTSQMFGHTYSFNGCSVFFTIFYIIVKTSKLRNNTWNHEVIKTLLNKSKHIFILEILQSSHPLP